MAYPPLVKYSKEDDYRQRFEDKYCKAPLKTFDGIPVWFVKKDFNHAFYESSSSTQKDKTVFSTVRAERIDWIEKALIDQKATLHPGWDSRKKQHDYKRRVSLANSNYVVVIQMLKSGKARFITAYLADSTKTLIKIQSSPKWQNPYP